ncbi:MAG TPA: glycine cleavage system protein GcvH [Pusillimonas sp.]|jgi:glycine cleavage system H protein|nr:glycine cleavage system protein H [Pusillimonas sp.]MBC42925.1 glycine cleavage system protein H [Pusillimonas sp.]HBT33181.1 glycine cleavage system protein GcvH [Pusillimonas sp.]HCN73445.1 glycine cleavage system protein GcvH [Pusillimonas sp.]HCP79672.1 glycine cleavage system protein GcvH [Pusillimonas sp.]|tara:strand:+ start:33389 stop:33763 length:375 start_codon:yes stop_codon:yes gene_type:complete
MNLPNDRKYTASHQWIKQDGDTFLVGITDHAQAQLGDLMFVGEVEEGRAVKAGDVIAVVESVKTASDIYAPVSGTVLAFNKELETRPESLNEEPYEAWILKLKADNPADLDSLLDAEAYFESTD